MDWLVTAQVACVQQVGGIVEQLLQVGEIVLANRGGRRFAFGQRAEFRLQFVLQQLLHFDVAAVARDFDKRIVDGQTERIGAMVKKKLRNIDSVFPHGEVQRRSIGVVRADERWVFAKQLPDRIQIAADGGAEHLPHVRARAGGPN